ncbi:NUDIX hydrolase [Dyadobacter crusticola]|uniref:NUDIX hydrolase n=1 Tax=Dyadobacter crusticola TaxID=292407 RepID=UPI0004E12CA3|nr:NUDIX hydrolase [Dyadobacter crusticola]
MKRDSLLALLRSYQPLNEEENQMYVDTIAFVENNEDCFERTLLEGHVTASGWVLSADRLSILLMHHFKLNQWFQPGGHCDGDPDVEAVARKEVWEETGINDLILAKPGIYDVDVHLIPANKALPAHLHYDIRFAFVAPENAQIVINSESRDVQWIPIPEVAAFNNSESIMRMVRKTSSL